MSDVVDRGSKRSFQDGFLGEVTAPSATPGRGGNTYISTGASRMIGQLHEHHHHYDDAQSGRKRVLEWLWPQDARNLKQTTIHRSSAEARRDSGASWLITRSEYNEWLSGGFLWIRGKGVSANSWIWLSTDLASGLWKDCPLFYSR